MTKFILLMFLCSGIPGNECQVISPPVVEFNTYHECTYFGYDYSGTLLKNFNTDFVDQNRVFTSFTCKENKII